MASELHDNISSRGIKGPSLLGTGVFVGIRTLDFFIQYGLLSTAIPVISGLHRIGVSTITPSANIVALDLPLKPLILLGMAAGSSLKHIYWAVFIAQEKMPVGDALGASIFNTIFNSMNSIISVMAITEHMLVGEQDSLSPVAIVGLGSYLLGLSVETISEIQRKRFKADERNKGKLYTGGLFSLARHINYGAYNVWRAGFATVAGGPVWGAVVATFFFLDFARRGVPVLDKYCEGRYGAAWEQFKKTTPYKMFPGIF